MNNNQPATKPLVSIAIPTYNRVENVIRLVDSVMSSQYKNVEIIISDDGSTDDTMSTLNSKYGNKIVITKSQKNLGVAHARNQAISKSSGDYIFLIDDDNVLDGCCIGALVKVMQEDNDVIMCGPVMYYLENPQKIWWAGTKRNMYTSKTSFPYKDQIPAYDYWETADFPNAWMLRANEVTGNQFDEKLYMHYEESDFAYRLRKSKPDKKFVVTKKGIIYHDVRQNDPETKRRRWLQKERVYYTARNRSVFHKRYSSLLQLATFTVIFNPIFTLYYLAMILRMDLGDKKNNLNVMKTYIKGVGAGYVFNEKK